MVAERSGDVLHTMKKGSRKSRALGFRADAACPVSRIAHPGRLYRLMIVVCSVFTNNLRLDTSEPFCYNDAQLDLN